MAPVTSGRAVRAAATGRMRPATRRVPPPRRRGVTLAESILYLTIAFSVIVFSAQTLQQEQQRQQEVQLAAELRQYIGSAQAYVSRNYSTLLGDLFDVADAQPGVGDLAMEIPLADLVEAGFLPAVFQPGQGALAQLHGHEYAVLARAVRRADAAVPQATATSADVDTDGDGAVDDAFTNGVFAPGDDELDLEVLVISRRMPGFAAPGPVNGPGGPIGAQIGNRVVGASEVSSAGFLFADDPAAANPPTVAIGPFGGWRLNVEPFRNANGADLLDRSGPGHFGALVALSNYGVVRGNPETIVEEFTAEETVSRCGSLPVGSAAHQACLDGTELYDSVVFNSWNRGTEAAPDIVHPAIAGVGSIAMSDEATAAAEITGLRRLAMAAPAGGTAEIAGLGRLAMAPPAGAQSEITGLNRLEMTEGRIEQLFGITCLAGGQVPLAANRIVIECEEVSVPGTLEVGGRLRLGGMPADEAVLMDVAEYTLNGSGDAYVPQPECAQGYEPRIVWAPIDYRSRSASSNQRILDRDKVEQTVGNGNFDGYLRGGSNVLLPSGTSGASTILGMTSSADPTGNGQWKVRVRLETRNWWDEHSGSSGQAPASGRVLVQTLCARTAV